MLDFFYNFWLLNTFILILNLLISYFNLFNFNFYTYYIYVHSPAVQGVYPLRIGSLGLTDNNCLPSIYNQFINQLNLFAEKYAMYIAVIALPWLIE